MSSADQCDRPSYVPPPDLSNFELEKFRRFVNTSKQIGLVDYHELHEFSVKRQNDFWLLLWDYLDIMCSVRPQKALDHGARIDQFPHFFPGAQLNYAENTLRFTGSSPAIVSFSERSRLGNPVILSWDDLRERVREVVTAFKQRGIGKNDHVTYIGANSPTPIIIFLASAAVGAIFCSLSGDMGEKAALDRLVQIRPTIMFADNAYQYNGKVYNCVERVSRIVQHLSHHSGLQCSILVDYLPIPGSQTQASFVKWIDFNVFLDQTRKDTSALTFEQVPFGHPMTILFSSGTTGNPKGMIHSHGGTLMNLKKEHCLHENMTTKDVYYHYTNIGWTMWNIFLGGLLTRATLLLYDGSPFYPTPAEQLQTILSHGTTVFGGSPRYYSALKDGGVSSDIFWSGSQIRLLENTGAVLSREAWLWMVGQSTNHPVISFSGGTEVCGSLLHGSLIQKQYPGEITIKELGVDVDVLDEEGKSCSPGTSGDLVIRSPLPNTPVRFWNDPDFTRYRAAYFEQNPGVWTHGDYIKINPATQGIIMLGRSDGALNPSGIRFGSSEIYAVLESFADVIIDSVCVGQRSSAVDEHVVLFVQLRPGRALNEGLEQEIRNAISQSLSPRHVPKYIKSVPRIPYNANGKKLEILVKRIISGGKIDAKARSTLHPDDMAIFTEFISLGSNRVNASSRL